MSGTNGERPAKPFASWWARDIIAAESCTLSTTARGLLLLLATYTNAAYYCDPSVDRLAAGLGVKKRAVQYARGELVAAGLIRLLAGGQGPKATNGYWLVVTGMPPSVRKGAPSSTLRQSTRVHASAPLDIHKGAPQCAIRVHPGAPEVDSEVSKERARVDSPPERGGLWENLFDLPRSEAQR